jgi:hypothetical protein
LPLKSHGRNGFAVIALDFSGGSVRRDTWQSLFLCLSSEYLPDCGILSNFAPLKIKVSNDRSGNKTTS